MSALAAGLADEDDPVGRYRPDPLLDALGPDDALPGRRAGTSAWSWRLSVWPTAAGFSARFPEVARGFVTLYRTNARGNCQRRVQSIQGTRGRRLVRLGGRIPTRGRWVATSVVRARLPATDRLAGGTIRSPQPNGAASPSESGSHGPLRFDDGLFTVFINARQCTLGNTREYHLLRRLHRFLGRFVSYEEPRQDALGIWRQYVAQCDPAASPACRAASVRECGIAELEIDGSQPRALPAQRADLEILARISAKHRRHCQGRITAPP